MRTWTSIALKHDVQRLVTCGLAFVYKLQLIFIFLSSGRGGKQKLFFYQASALETKKSYLSVVVSQKVV